MRGSRRTAVVVILPLLLGRVLATPQTPQSDRARPRTLLGGARVIMESAFLAHCSLVRISIFDVSVRCTGQRSAIVNSLARWSSSSGPSSCMSRSSTVSLAS